MWPKLRDWELKQVMDMSLHPTPLLPRNLPPPPSTHNGRFRLCNLDGMLMIYAINPAHMDQALLGSPWGARLTLSPWSWQGYGAPTDTCSQDYWGPVFTECFFEETAWSIGLSGVEQMAGDSPERVRQGPGKGELGHVPGTKGLQ